MQDGVVGGGGRNNVIPLLDGAENVIEGRTAAADTSSGDTSPPAESAEHAANVERALDYAEAQGLSDFAAQRASLAALVALADRTEVGRLWDDEVCACLLETGERQVEIVERCVRCGALMRSDAYHDAIALADRQREALWKFGRHDFGCPAGRGERNERGECNCGLDAVLAGGAGDE